MERFRFWCQKVLPLVYDDSLSYYELLCKVVNHLNELTDTTNELVEFMSNVKKFIEENTEKVVLEVLTKWLEDGTITDIFEQVVKGFTKHNSNLYNTFIDTEKWCDSVIPSGHIAQGFTTDGGFFYMAHHTSDNAPLYIAKVSVATKQVEDIAVTMESDGSAVTGIHANTLAYFSGNIICAYAGGDTTNRSLLRINPNTGKAVKITTNSAISAFAPFSVGDDTFAVSCVSKSQHLLYWYGGSAGKLKPFCRLRVNEIVPLLKQGILATSTHIYIPFSAHGAYDYNAIKVLSHSGQRSMTLFFNQYNECEMEDLARISGYEVMYWNDSKGNIYSFDSTGLFAQGGDTSSFSAVEQQLPYYMHAFRPMPGTTTDDGFNTWHKSNSVSILTSFKVPRCLRRTWDMQGYGNIRLFGINETPVSIAADTGTLYVAGMSDLWNGTKYVSLYTRLQYLYDETNSKYDLKQVLISDASGNAYAYADSVTEAKLQTITNWVHTRFSSVTEITGLGYYCFNMGITVGQIYPFDILE